MQKDLFSADGRPIQIGQELGRGGEGAVFEVPGSPQQVAKLYMKPLDPAKKAKLSFMASCGDPALLSYAAWPQATLHSPRAGQVVGFLMPNKTGHSSIFSFYSPAQRRLDHPDATWLSLLYAARNTAAAFDALHSHGHVIGDVNQGNIMVGPDCKVVLIDCDSFQVNAHGTVYHCEVGTSIFTPPELQSLRSFAGYQRSPNHDNFGLALLVFHLLLGGRHPYAGVPRRRGGDETLEAYIREFRYAYARDAQSRDMGPPPRSIPIHVMSGHLVEMFERAFTEAGPRDQRPKASEWVSALDGLRGHLRRCSTSASHIFPEVSLTCPWCDLEREGVFSFVGATTTEPTAPSGFVVGRTWALIEAVTPPPPVTTPKVATAGIKARPLPPNVPSKGIVTFLQGLAICVALACFFAAPQFWFLAVGVGLFGFGLASSFGDSERSSERRIRELAFSAAKKDHDSLVWRLQDEAGPEGFYAKRAEYTRLRDEYQLLSQTMEQEFQRLRSTAHDRQKRKHLERFLIERAEIPGVGQSRKAALRSFGIETAADVTRDRVRQVYGFGPTLTRAMVSWGARCEQGFRFDPSKTLVEADIYAVRSKYAARSAALEKILGGAPMELEIYRSAAATRAKALLPLVDKAAWTLAQATKDLSLL